MTLWETQGRPFGSGRDLRTSKALEGFGWQSGNPRLYWRPAAQRGANNTRGGFFSIDSMPRIARRKSKKGYHVMLRGIGIKDERTIPLCRPGGVTPSLQRIAAKHSLEGSYPSCPATEQIKIGPRVSVPLSLPEAR